MSTNNAVTEFGPILIPINIIKLLLINWHNSDLKLHHRLRTYICSIRHVLVLKKFKNDNKTSSNSGVMHLSQRLSYKYAKNWLLNKVERNLHSN